VLTVRYLRPRPLRVLAMYVFEKQVGIECSRRLSELVCELTVRHRLSNSHGNAPPPLSLCLLVKSTRSDRAVVMLFHSAGPRPPGSTIDFPVDRFSELISM